MSEQSAGGHSHIPRSPRPLPHQDTILEIYAAFAAETQHLARLYERKLPTLEALRKSLLHQASTGEL